MSPVQQSNPRTAVLAIGGAILGLVGLIALVVFALQQGAETGRVEVRLGDERFDVGPAERRASAVEADGPLLFSDVGGRDRDIYLQHVGAAPEEGWLAFDARRPGVGRECTLEWDQAGGEFVDPCDGTTVAADGGGLTHYTVEVTDDGNLFVDFRTARPGAADQP
jgi:hypothetical protein